MNIVEILILLMAIIITLSWIYGIRTFVSSGKGITRQTVNTVMLFAFSIILIFLYKASFFHLFWMFPLSWLIGILSLAFPISLLWIPGSVFARIITIGIRDKNIYPTSNESEVINKKQTDIKATSYQVVQVVYEVSKMAIDSVMDELKSYNLDDEKKIEIWYVISSMTLFQAQQTFWQNIIKDESKAREFERLLYESFKEAFKFDAQPHIKKMIDYIKQGEPSREIQYVGSAITKIIGVKDAVLMLDLSMQYFSYITNKNFFDALKLTWDSKEHHNNDVKIN